MPPRCGVCQGYSHEPVIFCGACADLMSLRPRLMYLEALEQSAEAKKVVDSVLSKCIKGQNYDFVKRYIGGEVKQEPVVKGEQPYIPSQDSVAALSSQLLTIDAIIIKRKNNKIQKEIALIRSKIETASKKLQERKEQLRDQQSLLETKRSAIDVQQTVKDICNEALYKDEDNKNLIKQINNSRSLLFQELINIYIIKRRKISGTARTIFTISFTPILSIYNLVEFNHETINGCLERMCKFVHQASKVLLLTLPYTITFNRECFFKPSIMKFDLHLKEKQQVWELSSFELRLFLNGVSRLIVDVHYLLRSLELDEDITSYSDLLKLDALIYKLANNDYSLACPSSSREFVSPRSSPVPEDAKLEEGKIDVDKLSSMAYDVLMKRVNSKNNEWHFVKKEYLVDDE